MDKNNSVKMDRHNSQTFHHFCIKQSFEFIAYTSLKFLLVVLLSLLQFYFSSVIWRGFKPEHQNMSLNL